jgi:hypothetical protein
VDLEGFYARANTALGETPAAIHWDFVLSTLKDASGLPQMIGLELDPDTVPTTPPALEESSEPVPAQVPVTPAPATPVSEVPAQPAAR